MATLSNPWVAKDYTYKGQLHCHSTESDGADSPANLVTAYKNAGYNFVCLTDHNKVTADPAVAGILFIPGIEETTYYGDMNVINITSNIAGTPTAQVVVNTVNAAGAVAMVDHPNWTTGPWTDAEIKATVDFGLLEIWNNKVSPNQNAENKYDACISVPNKRVWCVASDDCHNISTELGKGWIVVNADTLTVSAIMAQIAAGNFYATTGAVISSVGLSGSEISVSTPASAKIEWIGSGGTVLKTTNTATSDTYTITTETDYVRIRITRDSDGLMAWSQPVWITDNSGVDDSYTKSLLHCDGADNGTIFRDEANKPVGSWANVRTKTAQKKFGTASVYFDGADDQLILGNESDFEFGSGDFTVDFWVYPITNGNRGLFCKHISGAYDEYYCLTTATGAVRFVGTTNGTSWNIDLTTSVNLATGQWTHVAVVRNGDVYSIYIDGVSKATTTVSGAIRTGANSFWIGRYNTNCFYGYIDEFRVSKGIARWTANFTPPTAAYAPPAPPASEGIFFSMWI